MPNKRGKLVIEGQIVTVEGEPLPKEAFTANNIAVWMSDTFGRAPAQPPLVHLLSDVAFLATFERRPQSSTKWLGLLRRATTFQGLTVVVEGRRAGKERVHELLGGGDESDGGESTDDDPSDTDTEEEVFLATGRTYGSANKENEPPKGWSTGNANNNAPRRRSVSNPDGRHRHRSGRSASPELSRKPPEISKFYGDPQKDEISYGQWRFEVKSLQSLHTAGAFKEGVLKSLKGTAANLVRYLGPRSTIPEILTNLDTHFKSQKTYDNLSLAFYGAEQGNNETVPQFAARIEESINLMYLSNPEEMPLASKEKRLKERLIQGVKTRIRNGLRHLADNPSVGYYQLLVAARKIEDEEVKIGAKAKAVTTNTQQVAETTSPTSALRTEVIELKAAIAELAKSRGRNKNGKKKGQQQAASQAAAASTSDNQGNDTNNSDKPAKSFVDTRSCYRCKGVGHIAKVCPSRYLNEKKGAEEKGQPSPAKQAEAPKQ